MTDNLFEQFAQISKAGAYDIVAQQRDELAIENDKLKNDNRNLSKAFDKLKEGLNLSNSQYGEGKTGEPYLIALGESYATLKAHVVFSIKLVEGEKNVDDLPNELFTNHQK